MQGVSDPYPVLQAGGEPGLHVSHGFTTLVLPGGGGLGIGGTPSGSGTVPSGLDLSGMSTFSTQNPISGPSGGLG